MYSQPLHLHQHTNMHVITWSRRHLHIHSMYIITCSHGARRRNHTRILPASETWNIDSTVVLLSPVCIHKTKIYLPIIQEITTFLKIVLAFQLQSHFCTEKNCKSLIFFQLYTGHIHNLKLTKILEAWQVTQDLWHLWNPKLISSSLEA